MCKESWHALCYAGGCVPTGGKIKCRNLKIVLESVIRPTYLAVLFFVTRFSPPLRRAVAQDAGNSPVSPCVKIRYRIRFVEILL